MEFRSVLKSGVVAGAAIWLAACSSSDNPNLSVECSDCAVITGVSADYSSSSIDFAETSMMFTSQVGFAAQDYSDMRAVTYGDHFYRINRGNLSSIAKYSFDDGVNPIWEFSVGADTNPYDVVFASETKAYVLLWASNEILVIDPSVASNAEEANFIDETASIDLSAYDEGLGSNAATGILSGSDLYVLLEGLDATYAPQTSRLLKIDTSTDTVTQALDLTVKNAGDMDIHGTDIYVAGKGRYAGTNRPVELTGGIEKVDISGLTMTSSLLVDDDDANVGAQIMQVEIASAQKGYLTRYNAWGDLDVITFDVGTGIVASTPLTDYTSVDARTIEIDNANQLWVGIADAASPRIDVLSTSTDLLEGTVTLLNNPAAIRFADTTN